MAPAGRTSAVVLTSLLHVLAGAAASFAKATVSVSADNGGTWHELEIAGPGSAATELPLAPNAVVLLSARTRNISASIPSTVAINPRNGCKSVTLIRWVTAAGAAPFALGWTRSPSPTMRQCEEDSPLEVRTVETLVKSVRPRWAGYVRSFSVEDAQRAEQAAADASRALGKSGDSGLMAWLVKWNKIMLPLAVFAIVALANGIYLGITAVEEEEAAELRAREERLLRRITGQREPPPKVTIAAPRPSKKKRNGKQ